MDGHHLLVLRGPVTAIYAFAGAAGFASAQPALTVDSRSGWAHFRLEGGTYAAAAAANNSGLVVLRWSWPDYDYVLACAHAAGPDELDGAFPDPVAPDARVFLAGRTSGAPVLYLVAITGEDGIAALKSWPAPDCAGCAAGGLRVLGQAHGGVVVGSVVRLAAWDAGAAVVTILSFDSATQQMVVVRSLRLPAGPAASAAAALALAPAWVGAQVVRRSQALIMGCRATGIYSASSAVCRCADASGRPVPQPQSGSLGRVHISRSRFRLEY